MKYFISILMFLYSLSVSAQCDIPAIKNCEFLFNEDGYNINEDLHQLNAFSDRIRMAGVKEISTGNTTSLYSRAGLLERISYPAEDEIVVVEFSYDSLLRIRLANVECSAKGDTVKDDIVRCTFSFSYNAAGLIDTVAMLNAGEGYFRLFRFDDADSLKVVFEYDTAKNIVSQSVYNFDDEKINDVDILLRYNSVAQTTYIKRQLYEMMNVDLVVGNAEFSMENGSDGTLNNMKSGKKSMAVSGSYLFRVDDFVYNSSGLLCKIVRYHKDNDFSPVVPNVVWSCDYNEFGLPVSVIGNNDTIHFRYTYFPEFSARKMKAVNSDYDLISEVILTDTDTSLSGKWYGDSLFVKSDSRNIRFYTNKTDSFYFSNEYLIMAIHQRNRYYFVKDSLVLFQQCNSSASFSESSILKTATRLQSEALRTLRSSVNPVFGVSFVLNGHTLESRDRRGLYITMSLEEVDQLKTIETDDPLFVVASYRYFSKPLAGDLIDFVSDYNAIPTQLKMLLQNDRYGFVCIDSIMLKSVTTGQTYETRVDLRVFVKEHL